MPEFNPRARETSRGRHPDLDDNGELRDDLDLPANQRDFYRMWRDEPQREAFMARLARQQAQLPPDVQHQVAGQQYSVDGGDPYQGYLLYLADIRDLRRVEGKQFTGADIAAMTAEEYDALFDARGRPREGVSYVATGRDVDVTDRGSVDPFSAQEMRHNR
jgi:hypothetical protein